MREKVANNNPASSALKKGALLYGIILIQRSRYYFGWTLSELVCDVCGIGFSGLSSDGKPEWENAVNFYWFKVETANSVKQMLDNWNCCINRWLRYYCYERLSADDEKGKKTLAHQYRGILTFMLSSLWHGLYPAYYMVFFSISIHRFVAQMGRQKLRSRFLAVMPQWVYNIITTIPTMMTGAAIGPFMLLTFTDVWNSWVQACWIFHLPTFIGLIVFPLIPNVKKEPNAVKKEE